MILAGKRMLLVRRWGLCKRYELLDPKGHGMPDFEEFMENGDA